MLIVFISLHMVFAYQRPKSVRRHNESLNTERLSLFNTQHCVSTPAYIFTRLSSMSQIHIFPLKERTLHRNMSQEDFLNRLLSTSANRVHSESCMICLEEYNTLNTSTGIIECEVRLPCSHRIGSSCIVTWLRANNNCPACRATFFPAQPRPNLEHGIIDVDRPRAAPVSSPLGQVSPTDSLVTDIFTPLRGSIMSIFVLPVAKSMARHLIDLLRGQSHSAIAAVSVYMASHVVRRPNSPMEISRVAGVSPDQIQSVYRQVYPIRMQVIDAWMLINIAGGDLECMLRFLPPPDGRYGIIDDDDERHELQRQQVPPHLVREVMNLCLHRSADLVGLGGSSLYSISREIAAMIVLERHHDLRSPALVAAIGSYMASHLLGHQTSSRRIADSVGIDEGALGMAYARIYPLRHRLIKPSMLMRIGLRNLPRALEALPDLAWPPL